MVKIGFIVEGDCEKIFIESDNFKNWANMQGIEICSPVVNAKGGGNLLPQNIKPMVELLQYANAQHIVILTDLEREPDEILVRNRIGSEYTNHVFISVKAFEAWFLADSDAMKKWLKVDSFYEDEPEKTEDLPWDRLKALAAALDKKGTGKNKPNFAKFMMKHYEFSIERAAKHPNCASAKKFHDGLITLGKQNA
ncbi:MAG: hypothetical protein RLZZ66_2442 [Pseudomonadota bacterium]|jgi:hypothetical protein